MPKPNYQGEKRRRDMEKMAKRKEKQKRKDEKKNSPTPADKPAGGE